MSVEDENNFNIKLNEYYRLKSEYESSINSLKSKIRYDKSLTKGQKIDKIKALQSKCINCKRNGGTIFLQEYVDNERILSAICNHPNNPCNLDIKLSIGIFYILSDLLNEIEDEIRIIKNKIIDYKNKQLFNFISNDEVITIFDNLKSEINDNFSVLEEYNNLLMKKTENILNTDEYKKEFEYLQTYILQFKDCIKKYNETNNIKFISDAVSIYIGNISSTNKVILDLKYKENLVVYNPLDNEYSLIQNKNRIADLEIDISKQKVISFVIGNVKYNTDISYEDNKSQAFIVSMNNSTIEWNNKSLEKIWISFPEKLRNALIMDKDWMNLFLETCYNNRIQNKQCEFINPPNLIIPPTSESIDGKINYDFGSKPYNKMFNSLLPSHQKTLLSLFIVKKGVKNYNMLREALATQMANELEFNTWSNKFPPI